MTEYSGDIVSLSSIRVLESDCMGLDSLSDLIISDFIHFSKALLCDLTCLKSLW